MTATSAEGRSTSSTPVAELLRKFCRALRHFIRARTQEPADAEDLLQEMFVRIQKSLPTRWDRVKRQGWVYRIARNVIIDYYRRRRTAVR